MKLKHISQMFKCMSLVQLIQLINAFSSSFSTLIGVRSAYISPSPDPTCGITLDPNCGITLGMLLFQVAFRLALGRCGGDEGLKA